MIRRTVARLVGILTSSKRMVTATAVITFLTIGPLKFLLVRTLLNVGVPREALQAQDVVLSAALSAVLVWALLIAVQIRRKQQEEQLKVVADLNHHLRNALEVIFGSAYLRESEKATAILESVERIDRTLNALLPAPKEPHTGRSGSSPQPTARHG